MEDKQIILHPPNKELLEGFYSESSDESLKLLAQSEDSNSAPPSQGFPAERWMLDSEYVQNTHTTLPMGENIVSLSAIKKGLSLNSGQLKKLLTECGISVVVGVDRHQSIHKAIDTLDCGHFIQYLIENQDYLKLSYKTKRGLGVSKEEGEGE